MKLLLDTHSFLWFIGGDERLSSTAQTLIEDVNNDVFLSVASLWEMAIKISLGRLQLAQPLRPLFPSKSV
jgi:PIN domain nuclease of toxin-antitoxin system